MGPTLADEAPEIAQDPLTALGFQSLAQMLRDSKKSPEVASDTAQKIATIKSYSADPAELAEQRFLDALASYGSYPNPSTATLHYKVALEITKAQGLDPNYVLFLENFRKHLDTAMAMDSTPAAYSPENLKTYEEFARQDVANTLKKPEPAPEKKAEPEKLTPPKNDVPNPDNILDQINDLKPEAEAGKKGRHGNGTKNEGEKLDATDVADGVKKETGTPPAPEAPKTIEIETKGKQHFVEQAKLLTDNKYPDGQVRQLDGYHKGQVTVINPLPEKGSRLKPAFGDRYIKDEKGLWHKIISMKKINGSPNSMAEAEAEGLSSADLVAKATPSVTTSNLVLKSSGPLKVDANGNTNMSAEEFGKADKTLSVSQIAGSGQTGIINQKANSITNVFFQGQDGNTPSFAITSSKGRQIFTPEQLQTIKGWVAQNEMKDPGLNSVPTSIPQGSAQGPAL